MSSTLETSCNNQSQPVPKKTRGRPAKYSPEERDQKYKESTKEWFQSHKEYRQTYYQSNIENVKKQTKEYQDRARYALSLLDDIWNNSECVGVMPDDLKAKVQHLIVHKKILSS